MHDLHTLLRREFPEFEASQSFEAGIPVYFLRIDLEVLEPMPLSNYQMYFLHAVALGVDTREAIAHLLGVDDRDLLSAGASLLRLGYIEQGQPTPQQTRPILLTPQGLAVLREHGAPPVPRRRQGRLHFNALTWSPIPREETTWSVEQMYKEGLFILPPGHHGTPTLGDCPEKEVGAALSAEASFQRATLTALLELKRAELQYIAPVTVLLLRHRETGEQRVAVYRDGVFLRREAMLLQQWFEQGKLKLPADAAQLEKRGLEIPFSLPPPVAQAAQDLAQNEYDLTDLEVLLAEYEVRRKDTHDERERKALREEIERLQGDLASRREENESLRQALSQSQVEFLKTEEHRTVLERALRDAREEVIIISPWMNRRACNDDLCRLIGEAVARGVRVRIGYGMGREREAAEAERNRANVRQVRQALSRFVPEVHAPRLDLHETSGTHQKILVCDRTFAVAGSFNWLSYVGEVDEGYRNEIGTLFRHPDQVNTLAAIALQAWSS